MIPARNITRPRSSAGLIACLAGVGAAVWLVPWFLLDGTEAWDHWSYFFISLPVMALVAACAGFRAASRWWRWPLALLAAQYASSLALAGGLGNFFPLGMVAFAIFAIPLVIATWIGALLGRRSARGGAR